MNDFDGLYEDVLELISEELDERSARDLLSDPYYLDAIPDFESAEVAAEWIMFRERRRRLQ
jgi:hypothetical protein